MHFYGLTNNSKSTKSEKSGKTKEKVNVYHFFGWVHITGIATIQALYDYKNDLERQLSRMDANFNSSIVRL